MNDENIYKKFNKIIIDSRFRNKSVHPNSNSFILNLHETIDQVVLIELSNAYIPFKNQDVGEYVIIKINDLENIIGSESDPINNAFAIVNKTYTYITPLCVYKKYFILPYKLNKIDIKCYDYNGNLYNFGSDDFKIECNVYSLDRKI